MEGPPCLAAPQVSAVGSRQDGPIATGGVRPAGRLWWL